MRPTLLEFGRSRFGAQIGVTAVLHTWTRELLYHPHLHCIVTGGGLALTEERWNSAKRGYLFPVRALSQVFRGKFLDGLGRAYAKGEFDLVGDCAGLVDGETFQRLCGLPEVILLFVHGSSTSKQGSSARSTT